MASIFAYNDAPRVSSPWSTPGASTPQSRAGGELEGVSQTAWSSSTTLNDAGLAKLEPEPQDGSTEYKLHLLLRPRRKFWSTSTPSVVSGSHHSKPFLSSNGARNEAETTAVKSSYIPSTQTRQARLEHLTTQLLWRLLQSSPFHSSSAANLVLPLLPEATPRLGVPKSPAKILPGLEESQGALYEIGVADDGVLVGLLEEEIEESLINLTAMAASLGCVVEVQRKVAVGECEWIEQHKTVYLELRKERLWVAEALVRPDLARSAETAVRTATQPAITINERIDEETQLSKKDQLRIALIGVSTAGKSSLLGSLTTSVLDNARGKSRLSLLKHRHEISSGITSSVALELAGYSSSHRVSDPTVINYASRDVSSWTDIHHYADRLVFLSDSPGLPRFAKSTFRALVSWSPHWSIACVAADEDAAGISAFGYSPTEAAAQRLSANTAESITAMTDVESSLAHLILCLKLQLPLAIAITKMDIASKPELRKTLAKVLSVVKAAGRKPVLLSAPSIPGTIKVNDSGDLGPDLQHIPASDEQEINRFIGSNRDGLVHAVPIIFTSAVTGAGISQLHALLQYLPVPLSSPQDWSFGQQLMDIRIEPPSRLFHIDEVFQIPPSKVYSGVNFETSIQGVVLCGFGARGTISVGDELMLGPFQAKPRIESLRHEGVQGHPPSPAAGHEDIVASRSLSAEFGRSMNLGKLSPAPFARVRVVSLRNLRLPVRTLLQDQVGTVGVIPIDGVPLFRARKGMVLIETSTDATGYRSFSASFPSRDFASAASPPLILGGHAIVYVNSIRAAVKVTAVALTEDEKSGSASPVDVFEFDGDNENMGKEDAATGHMAENKEIRITFRFVSSVECMQVNDKVLVVPTFSAAGPVTGPTVATSGLSGFVGRVYDLVA